MKAGMAKGAYGAVFLDGDGNLYAGLNSGDHDLDGSTGGQGAIYQIKIDDDAGQAYAEFRATSQRTGSNDGAVDPRSVDPFAEVDNDATVQIRMPKLELAEGGNDKLMGGTGDDTMSGGAGDDTLLGGADDDHLMGDAGNDKMVGGSGDDLMEGGTGDDFLIGGAGENTLDGGDGDDKLKGGSSADSIDGGKGSDKIWSGDGADIIDAGSGADQVIAGAGDDVVVAGSGKDHVMGGAGHDEIDGGAQDDLLEGNAGDDMISGGDGTDKLVGGAGSDTISGGAGKDHIWGGEWSGDGTSDTFSYSKGGNTDTIHDFEADHDRIDLSEYGLSYEDIQSRMIDHGWATEINLEGIDKSGGGDKILLKDVKPEDLDDTNFIT